MTKKGFGLISVLIVVIIFSYLSVNIAQTNSFCSQIDKLKYLNFQGSIYMDDIKNYLNTHTKEQINLYTPVDDKFDFEIISDDINETTTKYHIYIKAKQARISIYDTILK